MPVASLAGLVLGWNIREEATETPKHHAAHATHATHEAHAIACNGPPSRCRRHRFFRGKKTHAAGVAFLSNR